MSHVLQLPLTSASATETAWAAIQTMIKQLSDYVVRCLPGFWKIAKACMNGKYLKRDSATGTMRASSRPATACRQMASDIIKLYVSTMSQFFTLSDIGVVVTASNGNKSRIVPSFVPAGTTVIAAAYFAEKVSAEITECTTELMSIDVGKEATASARGMLDSLRWRMLEVVASTWLRGECTFFSCDDHADRSTDAETFHLLEDWKRAPSGKTGETRYLDLVTTFQTRVLLAARKVASVSAVGGKDGEHLAPLSPTFKRKMRDTIIATEGAIFEGILTLGRGAEARPVDPASKRSRSMSIPPPPSIDPEARLLYCLSSFHRLTETAIPAFMRKVSDQLGGDAAAVDSATLEEMIESMDEVVYNEYVTHRSVPLCDMMRSGVEGADWASMPPPTEVRPYMHRIVLLLVEAHARVSDSAPALVERVIETLIDRVCETCRDAFKAVPKFGTGGILTATLEIEFLNQIVAGSMSPASKAMLGEVYNAIAANYQRRGGERSEREQENVRNILEMCRRGASVEMKCFQRGEVQRRGSK